MREARADSHLQGTARWSAASAIASQAARFPDLLPQPPAGPRTEGLDARDAALSHAIFDQVIRRWLTLAALVDLHTSQPFAALEATLQGVLLTGAAQLMLLDRIPAHAALDESVEIAKAMVRPGAGGMVNAVLRRVAEMASASEFLPGPWDGSPDSIPMSDGRVRRFPRAVLGVARGANAPDRDGERRPPTKLDVWSQGVSVPSSLLARWEARFGMDEAKRLALHSLVVPPVTLHTEHADRPALDGSLLSAHRVAGHGVYVGPSEMLAGLLDAGKGRVWVQDAGSSEAVREAARVATPKVVADVCAGRGTKTAQLLHAFPSARIIASDVDALRTQALASRFAQQPRVSVVRHADLGVACEREGGAELVLMDVPCSNTGVLPRRPEAAYRAAEASGSRQLERLLRVQRDVLRDGESLLSRMGGLLLYSTCSLDASENEDQVAWYLGDARGRERRAVVAAGGQTRLPTGQPGDGPSEYTDGSFWALVRTT